MHSIPLTDPCRERRTSQGLAGDDILLQGTPHYAPTGRLPRLERPLRPPEAPAHGLINFARTVGNRCQMHRHIVEHIAEYRPQELGLRMRTCAQRGQAARRIAFLADRRHFGRHGSGRIAVIALRHIKHSDGLAFLAINAGTGLLPQRPFGDKPFQPGRQDIAGMPGIIGEAFAQRRHHMRESIEPNHVGGAIRRTLRPPDQGAGQGVDLIAAEGK